MTLRADEVQPGDYVLGACPRLSEWIHVEVSRVPLGVPGGWVLHGRITGHNRGALALRMLDPSRFVRVLRPGLPDV